MDLDQVVEPMIADPDVHNEDVSKRYTHDTIRPLSYYRGEKSVDLGFLGSCMVHKGDLKILSQMLVNLEKQQGSVEFNAPLIVATISGALNSTLPCCFSKLTNICERILRSPL